MEGESRVFLVQVRKKAAFCTDTRDMPPNIPIQVVINTRGQLGLEKHPFIYHKPLKLPTS